MSSRLLIPLVYVFFLMATCKSDCDKGDKQACCSAFDISKIEEQINKSNETYVDRFFIADSTKFSQYYTKTANVYPDGYKRLSGIGEIHKFFYNDGKNGQMKMKLTTGLLHGSQDAVIEEGFYSIKSTDDKELDKGKFIAIWKEEDGVWKVQSEIWNSDTPRAQ